ncbi:MAG: UDP-N-acetylglucosamine 1-carboxyvinyltransferase [Bacillota bacterium]
MTCFIVEGGYALEGSVEVKGAKNSMLPIMAAAILNSDKREIELENIPDIGDMHMKKKILQSLGLQVSYASNVLHLDSRELCSHTISAALMKEMRSSIIIMGPMLARLGKVRVTYPGGCSIGPRPIDLHLKGLEALGARIWEEKGFIVASTPGLRGAEIHLDYPSVGATENLLMAAVLARGNTVVHNAAREPEIVDLQNFLNAMGAQVRGAGTETLRIKGVEALGSCRYRIIPDRIVAGTYLMAGAITGGRVTVRGIIPSHLDAVVAKMQEAGVVLEVGEDSLSVLNGRLKAVGTLRTLPYPGFPTDLQSPMMALLTRAGGRSNIVESVFEARFKHVEELKRMNARISVEGRTALVEGCAVLKGAVVSATDLRAGAALVLAGLAAEGTTIVKEIRHIDRGYEYLDLTMQKLGAHIIRSGEEQPAQAGQQNVAWNVADVPSHPA